MIVRGMIGRMMMMVVVVVESVIVMVVVTEVAPRRGNRSCRNEHKHGCPHWLRLAKALNAPVGVLLCSTFAQCKSLALARVTEGALGCCNGWTTN